LRTLGVSVFICGTTALILSCLLLWYVFTFNKKYGRFGLMKKSTRSRCPRFISNRKSFYNLLSK
ncbi:MAG: DUF4133 domain-containing protein, partial [Bacteroidales bacterium]